MKIKIGAHIYNVITKELEHDGVLLRDKHEIHINSNLQGSERFCTIIHEILHVINNELRHTDIEFLAQSLTQVLLDNPHIMARHPRKTSHVTSHNKKTTKRKKK